MDRTRNTADVVCYIQPITLDRREDLGWVQVNTKETAVVRATVSCREEALAVIERARSIARAMGHPVAIKKLVNRPWEDDVRLPPRVKRLEGLETANV